MRNNHRVTEELVSGARGQRGVVLRASPAHALSALPLGPFRPDLSRDGLGASGGWFVFMSVAAQRQKWSDVSRVCLQGLEAIKRCMGRGVWGSRYRG